jgi:hypothetical protein
LHTAGKNRLHSFLEAESNRLIATAAFTLFTLTPPRLPARPLHIHTEMAPDFYPEADLMAIIQIGMKTRFASQPLHGHLPLEGQPSSGNFSLTGIIPNSTFVCVYPYFMESIFYV